MKNFFSKNIGAAGRLIRLVIAMGLAGGGWLVLGSINWLALVLFASSAFVLFEAARGWCVLRACGIRTRI